MVGKFAGGIRKGKFEGWGENKKGGKNKKNEQASEKTEKEEGYCREYV